MNNILTTVNGIALSALAIAGLVVLTALGDVSGNVAVPVISGLAGVHIGANVATTNTSKENTSTPSGPPIQ